VRDVHETRAHLGLDALELDLHLTPQLQVQGTQRLIEEQHARMVDERPGNRDALLLATRELGRLAPCEWPEFDKLQDRIDLIGDVLDLATTQAEGDVLEHIEMREQGIGLEHRVDRPLIGLQSGEVLVTQKDLTRGRVLQSGDHPQRRCLAAAGGA
jgi:hypothetical protein